MRVISPRVRKQIDADPEYGACMLRAHPAHVCGGRITMEHALIHAGRQVDEKFAIIACCARGQEVDQFQDAHTMNKDMNRWVALNRATTEELASISKAINYFRELARLNLIFGPYTPRKISTEEVGIHYPSFIFEPA